MSREDDWIISLGKIIKEEENYPGIVNAERIDHVRFVHETLEKIISGNKISVSSAIHSPYKSMGYVKAIGEQIIISDYDTFEQICEIASNVEIGSRTDGKVEIDFTFYDVIV